MKEVSYLKEISKKQIEGLIKAGMIRNTHLGYVHTATGYRIGYYKTKGAAKKRYIEDRYADKAGKLIKPAHPRRKETGC